MIAADAKPAPKSKAQKRIDARKQRERFLRARNAEHQYSRALRKIAGHCGDLVAVMAERGLGAEVLAAIRGALEKYADTISPWARAVATRMLEDVSRRDQRAWFETAEQMGRSIRAEIRSAPTGEVTRQLLADQVDLITSLPRDAAERVHRLAQQAISTGMRPKELAQKIFETGRVTRGRAMLIARTETSRAATTFTQARAVAVGSEGYFWETVGDADCRPSHRAMQGKFVYWSRPPTLDKMTGHAGCLPNCRCWTRVEVPDYL